MLKFQHYNLTNPGSKCCFSSTMKTRWLLLPLSLAWAWMLGSCASPQSGGSRSSAPSHLSGGLPSSGAGEEAFAVPRKDRPGLATTFGKPLKDPMPPVSFQRAGNKPYGIDAIYYNNREGLNAMGGRDVRVSGWQSAAGGVLEWGVKGSFGFLPTYRSYAAGSPRRRFIEGTEGGTYSIVLRNRCKCDLQVVLSVDGLDVIDGRPASVNKRGYVIPAGDTLEVKGYRTGYNSVAAFRFSSVSGSYANLSRGETRNVGVIGLAVYTPAGGDPWTWMPGEIQQRRNSEPF
jgi:hypothetical protein